MNTYLHLEGVDKSFGRLQALRAIDLSLFEDELLVVLGPTGAGKTTLLRTIAGLEAIDGGRILVGGVDITNLSPAERDVALVFQNFSLYPDWSVRRNLEFPLRAPGRSETEGQIAERLGWTASLLRLEDLLERKVQQLSGGEMQRVAIGRAIVRRPSLFLLDEPLTNLDAKLRESLRVELAILRRRLGIPMVYVTHDQAEALSMGDRVAVLAEGHLLQVGTPQQVYRQPVSPVVAQQLGQPKINLFAVERHEQLWWEGEVPVVPVRGEGSRALLGVRPEDIQPRGGTYPATVMVVEDTGPNSIVLAQWGGAEIHLLVGKGQDLGPGDQIFPLVDPDKVILWEREEGG